MLLTVNVGNSMVSFGVFEGLELRRSGSLPRREMSLLAERVGPVKLARIVAGSVAPSTNDQLSTVLAMSYGLPVHFAGTDLPWRIEIQCDEPGKVGADRLLNAIAGFARTGRETVIADVGTAVTVDLVSRSGAFRGGTIAPGPATMARALSQNTELLPDVPPGRPDSPIGRNTQDAIRSGVFWGTVGLVETLIARVKEQAASDTPVLLTGGAAVAVLSELHQPIQHIPALTLEGLARIALR